MPPIDPNTLPKDAAALRKIVVDLCEQLRHESSEKDKYRSLLRELLDAQRNRKSEQLSKEQLGLFEAFWKASEPQEEDSVDSEPEASEQDKPEEPQTKKRSGRQPLAKRTLRVHSSVDEGDRGCAAEVRLRLYGEDGGEAFAAD